MRDMEFFVTEMENFSKELTTRTEKLHKMAGVIIVLQLIVGGLVFLDWYLGW